MAGGFRIFDGSGGVVVLCVVFLWCGVKIAFLAFSPMLTRGPRHVLTHGWHAFRRKEAIGFSTEGRAAYLLSLFVRWG